MLSFEVRDQVAQTTFGIEHSADLLVLGGSILLAQVIGPLEQLVVEPI